ncbi:MAG: hypothetical protein M1609_01880, partial [Firmicutes bacterium]|nr:hypothetical protein [Bacillota bacterium]
TQQLQTDLALKVVERRAEELRQLEQQGKTDLIERGLNGYKQSIEEVKEVGHLDDDQINKKLPEASKAVKDIEKDEKDALPNTQKSEPEIEGASKQIPLSAPTLIIEQAPPEISPNRAITPSGGSSQQTPAISPPINNSQSPHPDNNSNRPSENQSPKQDSPNPQGHTRNNGNGKK